MHKYLILLVFPIFLISCNENMVDDSPKPPIIGIDGLTSNEDLEELIAEFETIYGVKVKFKVGLDNGLYTGSKSEAGTTIGVCRIYTSGPRYVFLNQSWFASTSWSGKKVLIFHELGHCQFNRDHDSSRLGAMPKSIMYHIINPILDYFDNNQDYYLRELSNPSSLPLLSFTSDFISFEMKDNGNCTEEHGSHDE